MQETWVRSLGQEDSLGEGNGNPLQYSCLEKSHGQRSLVDYSPWDCKESDTVERLHFTSNQLLFLKTKSQGEPTPPERSLTSQNKI